VRSLGRRFREIECHKFPSKKKTVEGVGEGHTKILFLVKGSPLCEENKTKPGRNMKITVSRKSSRAPKKTCRRVGVPGRTEGA